MTVARLKFVSQGNSTLWTAREKWLEHQAPNQKHVAHLRRGIAEFRQLLFARYGRM